MMKLKLFASLRMQPNGSYVTEQEGTFFLITLENRVEVRWPVGKKMAYDTQPGPNQAVGFYVHVSGTEAWISLSTPGIEVRSLPGPRRSPIKEWK